MWGVKTLHTAKIVGFHRKEKPTCPCPCSDFIFNKKRPRGGGRLMRSGEHPMAPDQRKKRGPVLRHSQRLFSSRKLSTSSGVFYFLKFIKPQECISVVVDKSNLLR